VPAVKYENLLTRQVEEYIVYKRGLGYQIIIEAEGLRRFAAYTQSIGYYGSLTNELAVQWASLNENHTRFYMARRLETIHTFAVYISVFDPCAQIPQTGIFGKSHIRINPYIYTDEEISLLMDEAKKLFSPDGIRSRTVTTAIGLLRSTGIRVSELTSLKNEDIRFSEGLLFINSSKFKKDRIVPLHDTVLEALKNYKAFIGDKLGHRDRDDYFFVSSYGQRFNTRSFEYAFTLIRPVLHKVGRRQGNARHLRLYDMRHTFACETIKRWLESGEDANQKMHLLSTYMGHVKPADTYWYLSATPGLLSVACQRFEAAFGEGEGMPE
jgi:integrase